MIRFDLRRNRITWYHGFTLVELLVVIGTLALLAAILLPSLRSARESGRRAVCGSNLHQLAVALTAYTNEYNDWLPQVADHWNSEEADRNWHKNPDILDCLALPPNPQGRSVITCPSHRDPDRNVRDMGHVGFWLSYGMNVGFGSARSDAEERRRKQEFKRPGLTVAMMDAYAWGNAVGEVGWHDCLGACDAYRHRGLAQAIYLDGHVGQVKDLVHSCSAHGIDFDFWGCFWLKR